MNPPRTLGLFDATMLVMGGIVGSGIFINPYVVAQRAHTPALILAVWMIGGLLAMAGAFIWAELAWRLPGAGGQYLYLREAFHPMVAFLYGWVLLLVTQTGGMAAVAVTFARYLRELKGWDFDERLMAAATLLSLALVNCLGARVGSNLQSGLMLLRAGAIATLVIAGLTAHPAPAPTAPYPRTTLADFGAAFIPIAFAYGGWQTSSFIAGEMKNPRRDLTRGLIIGVLGVVALYVSVNFVSVRTLGAQGLAATHTPATAVMRSAWGGAGAKVIAIGIAISTLGFLSQSVLTAPRVYCVMAQDGLFFNKVGWIWPRTGAPVVAIALQGICGTIVALSGTYEQLLNFTISVDFVSFAATASALFVLRRRGIGASAGWRVPGHPLTTALFVAGCLAIVASTVVNYPRHAAAGWGIAAVGIPAYLVWARSKRKPA